MTTNTAISQNGFDASITSMSHGGAFGASLVRHQAGMSNPVRYGDDDVAQAREAPEGFTNTETVESRHVHPESKKLFSKCGGKLNFIRKIPIFGEPIECYGLKLVFTINTVEFFVKGLGNGFLATSFFNMYVSRFECDTLEANRYFTVSRMGWSIKPFTALISDAIAIFGYKKRWILTISTAIGALTCLIFGLLPAEHRWGQIAAACAFLGGYGQANVDILLEGLYSRKIRQYPYAGPNLVSSIWVLQLVAGIISSSIEGVVSDLEKPQIGPFIAAGCMIVCVPWLLINWLDEETNKKERMEDRQHILAKRQEEREAKREEPIYVEGAMEKTTNLESSAVIDEKDNDDEEFYIPTYCGGAIEFNKEVLVRNWRITSFCVVMTAVVVISAVINAMYDGVPLIIVTFAGSFLLTAWNFWALAPVVARASFFGFLNSALSIRVSTPFTKFFLGDAACNPGGPQFSNTFLYTINGFIGNVSGLVGVVAFSYIFSKKSYRYTFYVLTVIGIISNIFDLIMVKRWNLKMHIPDHYIYIFGDSIIGEVLYMLNWMPMVILMAQLCPRGSESMVYALLAAFSNFGQTVAGELGTLVLKYIWTVDTKSRPCDFHNLWKLVVLVGFGIPLVTNFFMIRFLIPEARICDELDQDGKLRNAPLENDLHAELQDFGDELALPVDEEEDAEDNRHNGARSY